MQAPEISTLATLKVSYQQPDAKSRLTTLLHQTGFAVLTDHLISESLIAATYFEWQQFFNSETKYLHIFDPAIQSGFFPFQTEQAKGNDKPDLKEFFHLYRKSDLPANFSLNSWELFQQMQSLAVELLNWIEAHTPRAIQQNLSMPLSEMVTNSPASLMRILHYPSIEFKSDPESESVPTGAIRAAAHEDINLITLLPAATASGLEILDRGVWREVPFDRGDIVINVGDMLQMASQGYFRSATHRVVNPPGEAANQSRYSMPMFLHSRPEVVLAGKVTAGAYLQERLSEIGLL